MTSSTLVSGVSTQDITRTAEGLEDMIGITAGGSGEAAGGSAKASGGQARATGGTVKVPDGAEKATARSAKATDWSAKVVGGAAKTPTGSDKATDWSGKVPAGTAKATDWSGKVPAGTAKATDGPGIAPDPLKSALVYVIATLFCALFGAVYELFSHEVYSYYMIYAFAIPLVAGVLPNLVIALSGLRAPGKRAANAWNSGVATLTVGCIFQGALDIYGTTSGLVLAYPVVAVVLLAAGVVLYAGKSSAREKRRNEASKRPPSNEAVCAPRTASCACGFGDAGSVL